MESRRVSRRRFLSTLAMATVGAIAAGCGPAPTKPPEPTAKPQEAATAVPATAVPEPTAVPATAAPAWQGEIEIWDWGKPRSEFAAPILAEWNAAHPGVTMKYKILDWGEMETKLLATVSAGTGPYISMTHSNWRPALQKGGVLAPYPDDMWDYSDLLSTPFFRDPRDGQIYATCYGWVVGVLFYNKDILATAGIKEADIPKTWDELMAMAQQLTKRDANGKLSQAGFVNNDFYMHQWLWWEHVYQAGGWQYNEDGSQAIWNQEPGVRALQFVADIYRKWKVDDPEFLAPMDAFGNEKAAFYFDGGYAVGWLEPSYPQIKGKWGMAAEPTLTGKLLPAAGMMNSDEYMTVYKYAPDEVKKLCFDYIKFSLASDERRMAWAKYRFEPPDVLHLLQSDAVLKDPAFGVQAAKMRYLPWPGEIPLDVEKVQRPMFDDVVLSGKDVKEAIDAATEQINAAMKASGQQYWITERKYTPPSA